MGLFSTSANLTNQVMKSRRLPVSSQTSKLGSGLFLAFLAWFLVAPTQVTWAQTENVIYSFCSVPNCADGFFPEGQLIRDGAGNFYGTAASGGISGGFCPSYGSGTVFELTASGEVRTLHSFSGPDGFAPMGGLVRARNGDLYGTTDVGRHTGGLCAPSGCGTVFELVRTGSTYTEKVLHTFTGGTDGAMPIAGLVRDANGNLYGTTSNGGDSSCGSVAGCGTVFKVTPDGKEEILHAFAGADGAYPSAGLILDFRGNLYGTTSQGGNTGGACINLGCGTIFKIEPTGKEIVLYRFTGGSDGEDPIAPLLRDRKGNLYGTTAIGGDTKNLFCDVQSPGCGVVFEFTRRGELVTLYTFLGYPGDGQTPATGLVLDKEGNLYGTTARGGPANDGTVFKLTRTGEETVLHNFMGGPDGLNPRSNLVLDRKGDLYGTSYWGGSFGVGTLFKVTP